MIANNNNLLICKAENYNAATIICTIVLVSYIHVVSATTALTQKWIRTPCNMNSILAGNGKNASIWTVSELTCNIQATKQDWVHVTTYSPDTEMCSLWNFDVLVMVRSAVGGPDECWTKAGTKNVLVEVI